jgi:hypothetical protein
VGAWDLDLDMCSQSQAANAVLKLSLGSALGSLDL